MRKRLKWVYGFGLLAAMASGSASAALIVNGGLTLNTDPSVFYQQTVDDPCIIGGPDCKNPASFPQTLAGSGGGGSVYDLTTIKYTLAQITGVIGNTGAFTVGIDYNDTSVAQTLNKFVATYYGSNGTTVLGSQTFDTTPDTALKTIHNGTGFSDFLLSGFQLAAGTAFVGFPAIWFNNDGPDNYFLISAKPTIFVPEPGTLALLGIGMLAVAIASRRRRSL
jgi:PEP-CTERM motif